VRDAISTAHESGTGRFHPRSLLVIGVLALTVVLGMSEARTDAVNHSQKLTVEAAAFSGFGEWLAIDGDTLVVGAVADNDRRGAAHVFVKQDESWVHQAQLVAPDGRKGDRFGTAVSVDGDTVAVAARKNDGAGTDAGAAYVFTRSGDAWSLQEKVTAFDAEARQKFGDVVSLDGDTLAVGARSDNVAGKESGSVYLFARDSEGDWSEEQKLTPADKASGDKFGDSVALDGDTLVVGASFDDDPREDSGSGYVFARSDGEWHQQAKLRPSDAGAGDQVGFIVAIHDGTVVLGAPYHDGDGEDSGAAYVFTGSGSSWSQEEKITPASEGGGSSFGFSVRVEGDRAVVGAPLDDAAGESSGAAYVFERTSASWSQREKLLPRDGSPGAQFGDAVEVEGEAVFVGAPLDDGPGSTYAFGLDDLSPDSDPPPSE
jgi:hypothetical protein